jgi:methylmalonyl-CoA epimerase
METTSVSHVGIAVADLEAAMKRFAQLWGREADSVREVPDQKARVAFFPPVEAGAASSGSRVELLSATSADSPIGRFLARHGEGLHHICLYVDDLDAKLTQLKAAGIKLIDEKPRLGAEGCRIAFIHPSDFNGVLIELEERRSR